MVTSGYDPIKALLQALQGLCLNAPQICLHSNKKHEPQPRIETLHETWVQVTQVFGYQHLHVL